MNTTVRALSLAMLAALGLLVLAPRTAPAQVMPETQKPVIIYRIAPDAGTISELNVDNYGLLATPKPQLEEPAVETSSLVPIPEPVGNALMGAAVLMVFLVTKLRYRARSRAILGR